MKNPYAPAFWCVCFALVLLSATYFYGVMLAHQLDKAMVFLDSACLVIGTLSIGVVAWASYQNQRVKKNSSNKARPAWRSGTPRSRCVGSRPCSTAISGAAIGSRGGPSRRSWVTSLAHPWKKPRSPEETVRGPRPASGRRKALAEQRAGIVRRGHANGPRTLPTGLLRPQGRHPGNAVIHREFEVLVYTWTARLKSFDHQLDEIELEYS